MNESDMALAIPELEVSLGRGWNPLSGQQVEGEVALAHGGFKEERGGGILAGDTACAPLSRGVEVGTV